MNARQSSVLLPGVVAAALAGGALAALVLAARDSVQWLVLGALIIAVVLFWVLVVVTLLPGSLPSERARPARTEPAPRPGRAVSAAATPSRNGWATAAPVPRWTPPASPPPSRSADDRVDEPAEAGPQPVNVVVPVPGGAWWQAAAGGTSEAERPPAGTGTLPPLDRLDPTAAARVVQCPRCGDFAVDLAHEPPGFAFRCRNCDHEWRWAPGADWPVTVIRPRLGRR